MRAELTPYRERWSTGFPLIPELPVGWLLERLKFPLPRVTVGIVVTPSQYYVESGIPAIRSLNVRRGKIVSDDLVYFSPEDTEQLSRTRLRRGDVVVVRSGQTGASAVVDASCDGWNCIDLIIIRRSRKLDSQFLQYLLSSDPLKAQIEVGSEGAIQQHFNIGLVRELIILEPPRETQCAIVAFLDGETAKIDRLTEVRLKQIEVLREQRAAIIQHAVTQGLDSDAPLAESGRDWLGAIPAHWQAIRLKFLVKMNPAKALNRYSAQDLNEVVFLPMECVSVNGHLDQSNRAPIAKLWKGYT